MPRPSPSNCLAAETPVEAEHAVLELASLLNAEVRMTQIILQALKARIMGLKKVVRLGRSAKDSSWIHRRALRWDENVAPRKGEVRAKRCDLPT